MDTDTLVIGSRRALCRSGDGGASWRSVRSGEFRSVFSDDDAFYAVSGSAVLRSTNGSEWSEVANAGRNLGKGYCFEGRCIISPQEGGARVFRSNDGTSWSDGGMMPRAGASVIDMGAGRVEGACI